MATVDCNRDCRDDFDDFDDLAPPARGSQKGLEKLADSGKGKGFLSYDEVSESMPADVGSDQIDDVVGSLGDEDIEIVDGATQVKIAPKRIAEEEAGDEGVYPDGALGAAAKFNGEPASEVIHGGLGGGVAHDAGHGAGDGGGRVVDHAGRSGGE